MARTTDKPTEPNSPGPQPDDQATKAADNTPLENNPHDHVPDTVDHDHPATVGEAEAELTVEAQVEAEAENKTLPDPYAAQGFIGEHATDNHIVKQPLPGPEQLSGPKA